MISPQDRYLNDPHFHHLVDFMVDKIRKCDYSPSELREAAVLASQIHFYQAGGFKEKYWDYRSILLAHDKEASQEEP